MGANEPTPLVRPHVSDPAVALLTFLAHGHARAQLRLCYSGSSTQHGICPHESTCSLDNMGVYVCDITCTTVRLRLTCADCNQVV
jgi:hypothetical protein